MAKTEVYYWVDESSAFGGGENPIQYGDPMPKGFESDPRFEDFKKDGSISTEKVAGKRVLSEFESMKQENLELKNKNLELVKVGGSGSGITQAQLTEAEGKSVQADLDKIAEFESSDGGELQGTLDLVKDAFVNIQQGDKKEEIWEAVKSVKELLKEPEGEA